MPEEVTAPQPVKPEVKEATPYKKSPMKWLLIYLVIGLLVYGLVYYFAYSKKNNNEATDNMQKQEQAVTENDLENVEETVVTLSKDGFKPSAVTIKAGTKLTWNNNSGTTATINSSPHPEHSDYPLLNLGEFADGDSFGLIFEEKGTYKYHNHLNPTQFGSVTVE